MNNNSDPLRKAAILVSSLDQQTADALLEQMSPEQAGQVRRLLMELDDIDPEEQAAVIDEFFQIGPFEDEPEPELAEPPAVVRKQPARPASWMEEPPLPIGPPFGFLQEAVATRLTPLLEGEHPQTIALVVSHLPPDQAGELLAALDGALQADVIRRLVDLDQADPEMLREVERGLQSRILEQIRDERRRAAGLAAVSSILAVANPRVKREILANLSMHDWQLAGRLTPGRLEFADFEELGDPALAEILAAVDAEVAILAMIGAPPMLLGRMLSLLPAEDARIVRRALDTLGPTRLSDVEEAQQELAAVAQRLATAGQIMLPRSCSVETIV